MGFVNYPWTPEWLFAKDQTTSSMRMRTTAAVDEITASYTSAKACDAWRVNLFRKLQYILCMGGR